MAGVAPHIHALVSARLNVLQVVSDIPQHSVHFPGAVLVGVLVGGKVVCAQGLAFFSLVAIRAADSQGSRKSNHYRPQARARPILWQDLKVLRFLRPVPGILSARRERAYSGQASRAYESAGKTKHHRTFHRVILLQRVNWQPALVL